ncbi:MAG: GHKL domain-containing protein [Clostridia bacterium]|nr:GHKL domain-containing protein [Clostridia bacterium]
MPERALCFAIIIPAAVIAYFPMRNQLKLPLRHLVLRLGLFLPFCVAVMTWAALTFSLSPNAVLFPVVILLFLFYHASLRVALCKSLSVFLSVISLMSILGIYASLVDARFYPSLGSNSYTLVYGGVHILAASLATLLLAFPMIHYGSRLVDRLNIRTPWWCTIPFSLLLTAIPLMLRPLKYETVHVNRVSSSVLVIITLFLLLWFLLLVIFYFITTSLLRSAKVAEEKQLLEMQESQFASQMRYLEETARERHDFRQSLRVLRELFDAGDMDALGQYISQYESSQPVRDVQSFCSDPALNAVLNFYAQNAISSGIDLRISVSIPRTHTISDVSLCRLTGNLLENALTAAGKTNDKWVELKMTTVNQSMLYILTTNPFEGHLKLRNGHYLSTTRHGDGIGLTSISAIAESYGGVAQFSHKDHLFYCNIALPL